MHPRRYRSDRSGDPLSRSVLVTGGSGGIGGAVCRAFGQAGWHVGIHYRRNKEAAEATLNDVITAGGAGSLYQADIREAESVHRMVRDFARLAPVAPVLICNAGIAASALVVRQREDQWADLVATNLTGTFHCLRAVAPVMMERGGGSIVVVGSYAGFHGTVGQTAYAASKAGLIGLVKTAALEWGPQNIRVNLVLPGWQRTELAAQTMPENPAWTDHALRRPPSLDEVAHTIVHLAGLADVSGQVWNCDSRNL
jgi:3-oxoacyl-[acyl-carrier protein] reductase